MKTSIVAVAALVMSSLALSFSVSPSTTHGAFDKPMRSDTDARRATNSGERSANGDAAPSPEAAPQTPLKLPLTDPKVFVSKSKRELRLYAGGELVRTYRIALGTNPVDDKVRQGDRATPEGDFYICVKNARSNFYLSLGLSYPNAEDAARGLRDKLITRAQYEQIVRAIRSKRRPPWDTALGGEIFIHGGGTEGDWTWGCVALANTDIKELFDALPMGTPVKIER
ncbi:MAG TPA: L,D-transpeptidase family protein [Pyrinomonadaceae bacterium]|nr:L,D-transpeptidase family protein [Pyrinomonadaceae bacterium]